MRAAGLGLRMASAGALATVALVAVPGAASAATVNVPCSVSALQSAITTANGTVGQTTLILASGCTYTISTPSTVVDGLPAITRNLVLQSSGDTTIRRAAAAPTFRLLEVTPTGRLAVQGLALDKGSTSGLGGAIQNSGTLVVTDATFRGNKAGNGGAIANVAGATARVTNSTFDANVTDAVGGGAIINFGLLVANGSYFTDNTAAVNGGAINTQVAGTTNITGSVFTGNTSGGFGGALSNLGTTTLKGTTVYGNTGSSGGGIATGNANVTINGSSSVIANSPDNCNPLNTITNCVD